MSVNEIILETNDKTLTVLAGNPLGRSMYDKLCRGRIDFSGDDKIIFIISDRIQLITSSFIQGFFDEIKKNLGIDGIEKRVEIISNNPELKDIKTHVVNSLLL